MKKTVSLFLTIITVILATVIPSTVSAEAASPSSSFALWPAKNMNITQGRNMGSRSPLAIHR